jgi:hypothetical protein
MKPEMRHKLAQLPFEQKIRMVGELIRLSRKIAAERLRDGAQNDPLHPEITATDGHR